MKIKNYAQFAVILLMMPFLAGCLTTYHQKTVSVREHIMQDYLTDVKRNDGINAQEAVLLARSELVFRSLERQYNLKEPLLEDQDAEHYSVQFFSSNKTLGQMLAGLW